MEVKQKIKLAFAFACFATISILAATQYLRSRKRRNWLKLCYLEAEKKPQSSFKRVLADNSYAPFKHLKRNEETSSNSHPYEEEITRLLKDPGIELVKFFGGMVGVEMNGSYVWVETESQLQELVEVLSKKRVFAVDTEQHSLRSFLGFTALMQISTQEEDYLVDTIALHDVMGLLQPVFADPSICKVFHGADNDVIWLQRDFHIYVVNLFDTAKACEVLSKPHKSLAYLLETYCGVSTNKLLQREDWRQRPLSGEMVQYARADAHYLLYIADTLASELKTQDAENSACLDDKFNFLLETSRRSNMICLLPYTKDIEASPGNSAASSILSRNFSAQAGVPVISETKEIVRRLCMWRDFVARVHDESLRYVLSDQAIVALASKVPKTETEIYDTISGADLDLDSLSVGSSLPPPSPVVCSHIEDLIYLLQDDGCNPDDVYVDTFQKHLDTNGRCPLSLYNYALLCKFNLKPENGLPLKQNVDKAAKHIGRKASRDLFVQKFSCKSPVYHNCRIFASDGRLLCYCDRRKLEWYVHRDLAKIVDDDPPAIMLLFEPKGRPEDEDNDFYIQSKKNICVGCGEGNHYLRYRIIPSCYRIHFPEHLKSHRSHDIVLLCVDCHEIAHSAAEKHKRQIAAEFGIPLFVKKVVDSRQSEVSAGTSVSVENLEHGVSPLQLRTAAMALIRHGSRMPSKRCEELMQIVMKYFGREEISEEDLERALLVGMSPHERRRLEKKRGLFFKYYSGDVLSSKANEANADSVEMLGLTDKLEGDATNVVQTTVENKCYEQEERDHLMDTVAGAKNISICCDVEINGNTSVPGSADVISDRRRIVRRENAVDTDEDHQNRGVSLSSATENSCDSISCGTNSPKYNKKLSLLGHGPHGKQVVDYLLKEYGEDGIRQFCQTWRQIFVEAIHPCFLPAGWDVKHSGRREFGEYSVYNPAKRAVPSIAS